MKVDYIIVGSGLAGINLSHLLIKHHKTFVVIDDDSQKSSRVAGGLYNPVVLKRFTPVWKSHEQLTLSNKVYRELERLLQTKIDYKLPVRRLFKSVEEQNNWFVATDKYGLQQYLSPKILNNYNHAVKAPYGFGEVLQTGRIDTNILIHKFREKIKNSFLNETFDYNLLQILENSIAYKEIQAKQIVFCDGFGLKMNPYFNFLPLNGTKGELLIIHAPNLKLDFVLKSSAFLIPLGTDLYIIWIKQTFLQKKVKTS